MLNEVKHPSPAQICSRHSKLSIHLPILFIFISFLRSSGLNPHTQNARPQPGVSFP
jgi:hypothetical protein